MNHISINASRTSRREGNSMSVTRNPLRLLVAAVTVGGLIGGAIAAHADPFSARAYEAGARQDLSVSAPPVWPTIPSTCTGDPCAVTLVADAGTVPVTDVNGNVNVPFWGFSVKGPDTTVQPAVGLAGTPQSIIKVPVGTTIDITLQQLGVGVDPIDLSFPSLTHVDKISQTSWQVTADKVGTMVFQPGANKTAPRQVAMGLVGVLIVTPEIPAVPATVTDPLVPASDCAACAYDAALPFQDETVVAMTDLDYAFAQSPLTYDMSYFGKSGDAQQDTRRVYHVINGKSFPLTDVIDVRNGDNLLLRYVNAGVQDKNMGLLGLRQTVLGRNASAYVDPQTLIAPLVGPGETADVAVAIPATALANQKYSLMDQSKQMNHGTGEGFGGALTFIDVWAGSAPTVDGLAYATATGTLTATGHTNSATRTLTNFQVTTSPTEPTAIQWAAVGSTAFLPAPAAGADGAVAVSGLTPLTGDLVWVRVQLDTTLWSAAASITPLPVPTVTLGSYDSGTGLKSVTAAASAGTLGSYRIAFTQDAAQPADLAFSAGSSVADLTSFTVDVSANHGKYLWVRVVDSNNNSATTSGWLVPYDAPTAAITAYDTTTGLLTLTALVDPQLPLSTFTLQTAVTAGESTAPTTWTDQTANLPASVTVDPGLVAGTAIWVQITDSATATNNPTAFVVV